MAPRRGHKTLRLGAKTRELQTGCPQDALTWSHDGLKTPHLGAKMAPSPPNLEPAPDKTGHSTKDRTDHMKKHKKNHKIYSAIAKIRT